MLDIQREVAEMGRMTAAQLRAKYQDLFGEQPRSGHKEHLIRRIAWRIQALAEGDLSERARQRAAELANDADIRLSGPPPQGANVASTSGRDRRLPMAGTILARHYHEKTFEVQVLEKGFEYDGQYFKSLTAVTEQITGRHWNGFHFFGLRRRGAC